MSECGWSRSCVNVPEHVQQRLGSRLLLRPLLLLLVVVMVLLPLLPDIHQPWLRPAILLPPPR